MTEARCTDLDRMNRIHGMNSHNPVHPVNPVRKGASVITFPRESDFLPRLWNPTGVVGAFVVEALG